MPKTILLADDSVTIQKVVGISFANEDVVLLTVDNGDDAIARARESNPDVVLADIMMPGKTGYEVCDSLKADPETQHIPVLLLSGTFESFDEDRARQVGADGHITKPFEAQALVDQVNELLARGAARASAPAASATGDPEDATLVAALGAQPTVGSVDETYDFFDEEMPAMPTPPFPEPLVEAAAPPPATPAASAPPATPDVVETEAIAEPEDGENSIYDLEPLEEFAPGPDPAFAPLPDESFGSSLPGGMNWDTTGDIPVSDRTALAFDDSEVAPMSAPESAALDAESVPSLQAEPGSDSGLSSGSGNEPTPSLDAAAPAPTQAAEPSVEEGDPFSDMDLPVGAQIYEPPDLLGDSVQAVPELETPAGSEPIAHEPAPVALPEADSIQAPVGDYSGVDEVSPEDSWASFQSSPSAPEPATEAFPAYAGTAAAPQDSVAHATDALPALEARPIADEGPADDARPTELPEPAPRWTPDLAAAEPEAPPQASVPASAGPLSPELEKRLHDTIEKLAWDALGDLSEQMVKEAVTRIETVAWEVIPQMAETLIREEIERLKGNGD